MIQTEIKKKKCAQCSNEFTPFLTTTRVCSHKCSIAYAKAKKEQKETHQKVREKENRHQLLISARIIFNAYIRERDKNEKCFCCGLPLGQNFQAGHVFSGGGHSSVRFDEDNVHAQRYDCNNGHRASLLSDMMVGCEKRIGADAFIILRERAYEEKKWAVWELQSIISAYREKLRILQSEGT